MILFGDFLVVFIHFFFYPFNQDLLSMYYASDTFLHGISRGQVETTAIMSQKHAFPSIIGMYVPNTQLQRKQEMRVSIGSPFTAHPITRYLLPSQAAVVRSTSTICFALFWF